MPTWLPEPRHCQWRCTFIGRATVNGAAKKDYSGEIVSPMVYFL
jgi:hypothetical protein